MIRDRTGGPRRGSGAKPKPEAERRDKKGGVMFTRGELAALERLAEKDDRAVATIVHRLVAKALKRR